MKQTLVMVGLALDFVSSASTIYPGVGTGKVKLGMREDWWTSDAPL